MPYKPGLATHGNEWPPSRVKALRQALGLTQQELAVAVGAKQGTTVSRWESAGANHKHPGPVAVIRLRALENKVKRDLNGGADVLAKLQSRPWPERIRRLRSRLKLSQAALAERVGVAGGTVSHWERGLTAPTPEAMKRLETLDA